MTIDEIMQNMKPGIDELRTEMAELEDEMKYIISEDQMEVVNAKTIRYIKLRAQLIAYNSIYDDLKACEKPGNEIATYSDQVYDISKKETWYGGRKQVTVKFNACGSCPLMAKNIVSPGLNKCPLTSKLIPSLMIDTWIDGDCPLRDYVKTK